jgi:peptide/nickel transport system ATP-binding protein
MPLVQHPESVPGFALIFKSLIRLFVPINVNFLLLSGVMNKPILSVKKLVTPIQIGSRTISVVDEISFDLKLGKTLAIVGESGSGKSITALSLMRILPTPPFLPSTGEVIYRGMNLLELPKERMRRIRGAKIAMIFQDPSTCLNPVYTIGYQLVEVAELHLDLWGDQAIERAVQALDEVGILNPRARLDDYPHQLSGGMKQRVMIAMALMCEPDILIADEPTTALDVTIQAQVLDLMRRLQSKKGMAILLITHDMGIVAEMADEVIVMYTSQAMETGNVMEIFDQMAHPYTMGLFGSRPSAHAVRGGLTPIKGTVPPLNDYPQGCRFHPRCPYVMPICKEGAVPHFPIGGSHTHLSKCWLGENESK